MLTPTQLELGSQGLINGRILGSVGEQRNLGVHVHRSLEVASQVERVVKKAYGLLAFISRGIEFKSREVMMQLYKTLVRPHLEYYVQFWLPHYRKDVEALERVQRRFTRMLPGLESMDYDQRLRELGLYSLEKRRMRGDMIEVYKILRGIDRVDSQRLFPRAPLLSTRGHGFKLSGGRFKGDIRGRFYTQRVVGAWNALPESVVEADTLVKLKRLLDRYMEELKVGGLYGRQGLRAKWPVLCCIVLCSYFSEERVHTNVSCLVEMSTMPFRDVWRPFTPLSSSADRTCTGGLYHHQGPWWRSHYSGIHQICQRVTDSPNAPVSVSERSQWTMSVRVCSPCLRIRGGGCTCSGCRSAPHF
ncbi:uncharacterized protein LOC132397106 [Hypanus sabinus]|uniref:uncharacterized protein LOC132397106 n=1 Tax=Hypanus sabinus TaxID=79690 RepID=UPI0028C424C7|nr:uncharacterized protein LOC132397106 [Hypanus sabinus]XP_059831390.1 uncharacterized protein LOC132397106 [Hypanus sabinus]